MVGVLQDVLVVRVHVPRIAVLDARIRAMVSVKVSVKVVVEHVLHRVENIVKIQYREIIFHLDVDHVVQRVRLPIPLTKG